MKNIIKLLVLGGTLALGSCDLEVQPRQNLTPELALETAAGYQSLVNATYGVPRAFNQYGQTMMIAPEIMADNLRIIANTGRYIGQEANADRAHIGLWTGQFWGGINNTNIIISGVNDAPGDAALKLSLIHISEPTRPY